MGATEAKAPLQPQPGEVAGYISRPDAEDMVDVIYHDMAEPFAVLPPVADESARLALILTEPSYVVQEDLGQLWMWLPRSGWRLVGTITRPDAYYEHSQATLADVWLVQHNLGKRPAVHVQDAGGTHMYGTVKHLSLDTLTITFGKRVTGLACCS